jgi:hypothetical protein
VDPNVNYQPSAADFALFWKNVDISDVPGACWPYREGLGSRGAYQHVRIWLGSERTYAHRAAFFLSGGTLADDEIVCHECDSGSCCAPLHLHSGTVQTNNAERDQRNRRTPFLPRGVDHPSSKLTMQTLEVVRRGYGLVDAVKLALLLNISATTVRNVWANRTYQNNLTLSSDLEVAA